jgi:photosystem II stability/assembly factor-like uncharacterized protein
MTTIRMALIAIVLAFATATTWAQNSSVTSSTPRAAGSQSHDADLLWYGKAPPGWGGTVTAMKLIAPGVGWAMRGSRLYWTDDDGANWKDITPPVGHYARLSGIFFLNPSSGWVAVNDLGSAESTRNYVYLFSTIDGGATWSRSTIPTDGTSGVDTLAFADSVHGWVGLSSGSGALVLGQLLMTSDGGRTWSSRDDWPGLSREQILLVNPKEGWYFGDGPPNGDCVSCMYVTRDGGRSWKRIEPPGATDPNYANVMGVPTFEDTNHGYIVVNSRRRGEATPGLIHTLTLWKTSDGGRTWKPDRSLDNIDEGILNACLRFSVVGSDWIFGSVFEHRPVLTKITQGAEIDARREFAVSGSKYREVVSVSFATVNQGWAVIPNGAVIGGDLLSTTDGGATWTDITPGPKPHVIHPLNEPPR